MQVGTTPLLFNDGGADVTLHCDSGATVSYGASRTGTATGTIASGDFVVVTGPTWVWSASSSEVHTREAGRLLGDRYLITADSSADHDIVPVIQSGYDRGARTFTFKPDGEYLADSPGFFDADEIQGVVTIDLNGSVLYLGENLPTSDNWTEDTTVQWAFFPNNLRSGWNTGTNKVTSNAGKRAAGVAAGSVFQPSAFGYLKVVNGTVRVDADDVTGGAQRGLSLGCQASTKCERVTLDGAYALIAWTQYADASTYEDCQIRNPIAGVSAILHSLGSGDGIHIKKGHGDDRGYLAFLTDTAGATIEGCVGGSIKLKRCSAIKIVNWHAENDLNNATVGKPDGLFLDRSQATLEGGVSWTPKTAGIYSIEVNDSAGEGHTDLVLRDQRLFEAFRTTTEGSGGEVAATAAIHITAMNDSSRIRSENSYGGLYVAGVTQVYPYAPLITSDVAGITTALAAGQHLIAAGNWELRKRNGSWEVVNPYARGLTVVRQKVAPTISNVLVGTGRPELMNGTLVDGTTYEYALAVIDEEGNYGPASTATSQVADASGVLTILTSIKTPGRVRVWRKAAAGVLAAPTAYCDFPTSHYTLRLYDTGVNVNQRPWITTAVPVPNTVAGSDHSANAIKGDAGRLALAGDLLTEAARDPESMFVGAVTIDSNGAYTSAPVVWPDGATGTYTGTASTAFVDAVDSYTITHVLQAVTTTYTQSAVTRDALTGKITNRPAITVA